MFIYLKRRENFLFYKCTFHCFQILSHLTNQSSNSSPRGCSQFLFLTQLVSAILSSSSLLSYPECITSFAFLLGFQFNNIWRKRWRAKWWRVERQQVNRDVNCVTTVCCTLTCGGWAAERQECSLPTDRKHGAQLWPGGHQGEEGRKEEEEIKDGRRRLQTNPTESLVCATFTGWCSCYLEFSTQNIPVNKDFLH